MTDCIFCKIASGEISCQKIYEDDNFLAFLDHQPASLGHCLVIPKDHYQWTYDVPNFGEFWEVAKKIALTQIKNLDCEFVSFVTMGKEVPHAHIHIIPRYQNGPHQKSNTRLNATIEELIIISNKLKI